MQEVQIFADEIEQQVCQEDYRKKIEKALETLGLKNVNVIFREHDAKVLIESLKDAGRNEELIQFKAWVKVQVVKEMKAISQALTCDNNSDLAIWAENAFNKLNGLQESNDNLLKSNLLTGDLIYSLLLVYLNP